MSFKNYRIPGLNILAPEDVQKKMLQESIQALKAGAESVGVRTLGERVQQAAVLVTSTTELSVGELSTAYRGTNGYTRINVRIPYSLSGGATQLSASLWQDGLELDREQGLSSSGVIVLEWVGIPSAGSHKVQVKMAVNAGTATLFGAKRWGRLVIVETLL
jgi:hypothetical protein